MYKVSLVICSLILCPYFIANRCSHFTLADYKTILCRTSPSLFSTSPSTCHPSQAAMAAVWTKCDTESQLPSCPVPLEGDAQWWPPLYLDYFHSSTTISPTRHGTPTSIWHPQLGTVPLGSQRGLSLLFADKKIVLVCMCEAKVQTETFSVKGMSVLKTWFGSRQDKYDHSLRTACLFFLLALWGTWKMRWQEVVRGWVRRCCGVGLNDF